MGILKKLFGVKVNRPVKLSTVDYNQYFENDNVEGTPVELFKLGDLNLPTGQIIACDPLVCLHDAMPFTRAVKGGVYPVTACIAKTEDAGDRYALIKLEFSPERAIAWEMALVDGQDTGILVDDQFFGFGVDAGLGCFCDVQSQKYYNEWADELRTQDQYEDIVYNDFIAPGFKKNSKDPGNADEIGDWLNFNIPTHPDLNIIMFSSGYGDGSYPGYWGVTANGDICSLVIDFQVIGYDF